MNTNVGGSGNYGHVSDQLLRYFKDLGCKTMLDIGCGVGMKVIGCARIGRINERGLRK